MSYATTPGLFPMQGGCPCGQTRFNILQAPLIVHCCHCTACQLQQGTAFAINAVIESHNIVLLPALRQPAIASGETGKPPIPTSAMKEISQLVGADYPPNLESKRVGPADKVTEPLVTTLPTTSTAGQHIATCPSCHAGLWSYYADAGRCLAYVRVGTLDRAMEIYPDVHIYTRTMRKSFLKIDDGKPQFEGYYPDRREFLRPDCKERMEALNEQLAEWKKGMMAAVGM